MERHLGHRQARRHQGLQAVGQHHALLKGQAGEGFADIEALACRG